MNSLNLNQIAKAHRLVLIGAIVTFGAALLPVTYSLLAIPFAMYCTWVMTKAIQASTTTLVVYSALMLIPIVNIFGLISLNMRGSALLRANGVKVGPFGVHSADLPVQP